MQSDTTQRQDVTPVLVLHDRDNVAIARRMISQGTALGGSIVAKSAIPAGHKVSVTSIKSGESIVRYGQIIGFATKDIEPGFHVHLQNMALGEFYKDYAFGAAARQTDYADTPATFLGIRRSDGRAATRNYVGILSSVNCSSHVANVVAEVFKRNPFTGADPLAEFPNVDGVVALTHKTGCGMTGGEPLNVLRRTLGGYARHVNFSHVIVLGLGCEVNQIGGLLEDQRLAGRVRSMDIQTMGGARKTVAAAVEFVRDVLKESNQVTRQPIAAGELIVGLQCGGSDGLSGVTANPALGTASDILVRHRGTVILSETPETYGAEHLLTRRAVSREVGEKLVALMDWWDAYFKREGAVMNDNRSPGNMAGGISTIVEKSLGAMAKGGTTNLVDVVKYGETVKGPGLVFMDTPGYDPVSATGQVAGGANLICFTTGRGSVFGCKPAPSIKLASNTAMYQRMKDDMDINCGEILSGGETVEECGKRVFDLILRVASGERTKSEEFNFGADEFAPWVLGATV
ncbi:altronate dehydratase family protein [Mesorhizobium sp. M0114]|uniref:UxaA family hydrolase n=1 Tax=unclassified Mesorhizobium TaxID=325217 RepID=UPI0033370666